MDKGIKSKSIKSLKQQLEKLLEKIWKKSKEKEEEKVKKINNEYTQLKTNTNNDNDISEKTPKATLPNDFFIEHKEIFKNFLCLKNTVIIELNGNEKRKKTFIINFNSKPFNSFIYPNNLKKSLNDILQDI